VDFYSGMEQISRVDLYEGVGFNLFMYSIQKIDEAKAHNVY